MADRRVRSGAAGAANGTTWTDAYLTIGAAIAASTNADTIWVADDHAEVFTIDTTWTCPTSPGLRIIAVDTHTTDPPTGVDTTGGSILTTTNSADLFVNGFVYGYGLTFNIGDGADQCQISWGNSDALSHGQVWESCTVNMAATSGTSKLNLGSIGTNILTRVSITVIDLTLSHESTGSQAIEFRNGRIHVNGLATTGTPDGSTTLGFFAGVGLGRTSGPVLVENFDISAASLGSSGVMGVTGISDREVLFRNGKIPASAPLTVGSFPGNSAMIVRFENVDSGDTNYRFGRFQWEGLVISETTITMVGGTSPSQAMVAVQEIFQHPLSSMEMAVWIPAASIGNTVTITVPILRDSATNLQDDEVWLEGSGPDVSGSPKRTRKSSRAATPLTTPADIASSAETWNESMSNPNEQEVSFSFTAEEEGYVNCRVMLAKSTGIYVNGAPILS